MRITEDIIISYLKITLEWNEGLATINKTYNFSNNDMYKLNDYMKEFRKDIRKAVKVGNIDIDIEAFEYPNMSIYHVKRFRIINSIFHSKDVEYVQMTENEFSSTCKVDKHYKYDREELNYVVTKLCNDLKSCLKDTVSEYNFN